MRDDAQAYDLCELTHSQPLDHARAVDIDRAHADSEVIGDQLVRLTRQQSLKNFALARTESPHPPGGVGDIVVAIGLGPFAEGHLDRPEQSMVAVWLLQEIGCARVHRANSRLNISCP